MKRVYRLLVAVVCAGRLARRTDRVPGAIAGYRHLAHLPRHGYSVRAERKRGQPIPSVLTPDGCVEQTGSRRRNFANLD